MKNFFVIEYISEIIHIFFKKFIFISYTSENTYIIINALHDDNNAGRLQPQMITSAQYPPQGLPDYIQSTVQESEKTHFEPRLNKPVTNQGIITHDSETLQVMLDAAPVAIQIVGPEGIFIDCNQYTIELFKGKHSGDIVGKPPSILSPPVQGDGRESGPAALEKIQEAFTGKRVTFSWEHKRLNGEIFPARVILNQIQYEGNICLMASVIDVTEIVRQVEYLEKSVVNISQDIHHLSSGKTDFESSVIPGDEWTKDAEKKISSIHQAINTTRTAIERIIHDFERTTKAALDGDRKYRADPAAHQGSFSSIIEGLNLTLDATVTPVAEAMRLSHDYSEYKFNSRFNPDLEVKGDWISFKESLDQIGTAVSHAISLLNKNILELSEGIEEATSSIEEITSGSQEISSMMESISKNSTSGDSSITQIIRAMEDLTHTVSEVSQKADSVAGLSQEATSSAKRGMELVKKSELSMADIMRSAGHVDAIVKDINAEMSEIGKIVQVISDIANQTNLLSLNAAIEAARAGEAGRGFAVVAAEVKTLAQDSRKSAGNISDMITNLQKKAKSAEDAMAQSVRIVEEGSSSLTETVSAFSLIDSTIEDINRHIIDVASASEEQAASVEEVTASMQEVAFMINKTSNDVKTTSTSTKEISTALEQMTGVVNSIVAIESRVHGEISRFSIDEMRI